MRTVQEIRRFSDRDARRWIELSNVIARATAIGLPMMRTNPVRPEVRNVVESVRAIFKGRRQLREIIRWISISQAEAIEEYFEHSMVRGPLTVNLPFMPFNSDLSGWALIYLGVLQKWGVAMFEGGTGAFPAALIRCLRAHGGRVRCSAPVAELIVGGGRVSGVRLESGEAIIASRAVLTACGPSIVLNRMLPAGLLPDKLQHAARQHSHYLDRLRQLQDQRRSRRQVDAASPSGVAAGAPAGGCRRPAAALRHLVHARAEHRGRGGVHPR
jgi:phytoene dehydrogenase-like protein